MIWFKTKVEIDQIQEKPSLTMPLVLVKIARSIFVKQASFFKVWVIACCLLLIVCPAFSQLPRLSVGDAVEQALRNNRQVGIHEAEVKVADLNVKAAGEVPKMGFFAENEDLRPSDQTGILKIGISQSLPWPGVHAARKKYFSGLMDYAKGNRDVLRAAIRRDVSIAYYELWYLQDKHRLFERLDSLYSGMAEAAATRLKAGESAVLEKVSSEAKSKELKALLEQNTKDMLSQQQQLLLLLNSESFILPLAGPLQRLIPTVSGADSLHPVLGQFQQKIAVAEANISLQRNANKPELAGRFFSQRVWGAKDPFTGFSVTAAFPVFGAGAYKSKVDAAKAEREVAEQQYQYQTQVMDTHRANALAQIGKSRSLLDFYEQSGLGQAGQIISTATLSYRSGEISFADLSQFLSQAIGIRQNYLDVLNQYNQAVIQFNYFHNK